jgi:arginine/lysine/ornithine decarboxylase
MVLSVVQPGEEVLVARNAHKSILAGIILSGAVPRFVLPGFDAELGIAVNVTIAAIQAALETHPTIRVMTLTSPNYYGIAADMRTIVGVAHAQGKILLVDEAHGPHLHFHPMLPASAVDAGADLTVQSTHKIVGGMTQASMLHVKGQAVDGDRVAGVLQLLQSTSPSYILMASLDLARMQMATEGRKLLGKAIELAEEARARINRIPGLRCLTPGEVKEWGDATLDVTKLTISVKELGLTGYAVSTLLNSEFDIQVEMADLFNILVIVSIGDRRDDLDRLVRGLEVLAQRRQGARALSSRDIAPLPPLQEARLACPPREAYFGPFAFVPLGQAAGRVCSDIITIYPPGIPILVPGEEISPAAVDYLRFMGAQGARIDGVQEHLPAAGVEVAAAEGPGGWIRVLVN